MSKPRNTPLPTSRARHARRMLAGLAAATVAVVVTACSDAPSSPTRAAAPDALRLSKSGSGPGQTNRVGRAAPLAGPVSVSFHIDPDRKGKFSIPGTGLEIEVPRGAVDEPVTITATALPGDVVAYEFHPHGLVFRRPLQARQDVDQFAPSVRAALDSVIETSRRVGHAATELEIAYFADASALAGAGAVDVQEFLGSTLDFKSNRVEFSIEHFSGYMVAWGRSRYSAW